MKDADGTMDVGLSDGTSEEEEVKDKPEEVPEVSVKLKVDDSNNVKVNMGIPLVSYAPKTSKPPTSSGMRFVFYLPSFCLLCLIDLLVHQPNFFIRFTS